MRIALRILKYIVVGLVVLVVIAIGGALSYRAYEQAAVREATRITAPNGIETLETVRLGGIEQWISIRGQDTSNPVLLFLHGGPGNPDMPYERLFGLELEKHFVVVHWDQRGAGKTLAQNPDSGDLTVQAYVDDAVQLIDLLRARFHQDKITLVGHSWGSAVGVLVAKAHPELLRAYVGMGQLVNLVDNERLSLDYTVAMAERDNNEKALAQLNGLEPPYDKDPQQLFVQRQWLTYYDGVLHGASVGDLVVRILTSPEYSLGDLRATRRGMVETPIKMWPKMAAIDLFTQAPKLDVPVYFFEGRYDFNAPTEIVERYYEILEAPHKELIWFESSGHLMNVSEPGYFQEVLISKLLTDTGAE